MAAALSFFTPRGVGGWKGIALRGPPFFDAKERGERKRGGHNRPRGLSLGGWTVGKV